MKTQEQKNTIIRLLNFLIKDIENSIDFDFNIQIETPNQVYYNYSSEFQDSTFVLSTRRKIVDFNLHIDGRAGKCQEK